MQASATKLRNKHQRNATSKTSKSLVTYKKHFLDGPLGGLTVAADLVVPYAGNDPEIGNVLAGLRQASKTKPRRDAQGYRYWVSEAKARHLSGPTRTWSPNPRQETTWQAAKSPEVSKKDAEESAALLRKLGSAGVRVVRRRHVYKTWFDSGGLMREGSDWQYGVQFTPRQNPQITMQDVALLSALGGAGVPVAAAAGLAGRLPNKVNSGAAPGVHSTEGVEFVYGIRDGESHVQSILFDKRLWTAPEAVAWLKEAGFKHDKVDPGSATAEFLRFRQLSPEGFTEFRQGRPGKNPTKSRFEKCVESVEARGSAYSPRGVCAAAGRAKYGAKAFAKMAAKGRAAHRHNPKRVWSLEQHGSIAEILAAADGFEARVKAASGRTYQKAFKAFRAAASWARVKLFEIAAPNPVLVRAYPVANYRSRKNPLDVAVRQSEEFHGLPSAEVREYTTNEHYHSNLSGIGPLVELVVLTVDGDREVELDAPDPDGKAEDVVFLARTEDDFETTGLYPQLEMVGGDQALPMDLLKQKFRLDDTDFRDRMLLGTVVQLTYRTKKIFEGGGKVKIDFYHDLGEADELHGKPTEGYCPVLIYKPRSELLELAGGRYYIGAVDSKLGASPGIIG